MKTSITKNRCGIFAALMLVSMAGSVGLLAQDNVVALGRVNSVGTLLNGTTTVNGTISTTQNGTGDYFIDIEAPGAFTGADANDFVVQASLSSVSSGDESIKATVSSVTDDLVRVIVHTDDVEDLTNPDLSLAVNHAFSFVVFRVPDVFPANTGTRYLLSTGTVSSAGNLVAGAAVEGITVVTTQNGIGDYNITLAKPGGFVGDVNNDYVLALTLRGGGTQDQVIRGGVLQVASDDELVVNVHTDDAQSNPDGSVGTPESDAFYFTIYRIPTTNDSLPASKLLVSLARVSSAGALLTAPNSFDGGTIASSQTGTGEYEVTITSPGAFAGREAGEFVAHATLNQSLSTDESIRSNLTIPDDDTLLIAVKTIDVETSGQLQGIFANSAFYLSVFDAKAELQPDLRIGEKGSLTKMKGNNKYNATGAGQQLKLDLVSISRRKYFFALENDGNIADNIRVKEKGAGSRVRTNYFRLTGGRANVTAKVKKAGSVEEAINPDAFVRYEGRIKYLSADNRPGRKIRLTGTSLIAPSARDTVRLKVSGI
jgi:hypothetical protein